MRTRQDLSRWPLRFAMLGAALAVANLLRVVFTACT